MIVTEEEAKTKRCQESFGDTNVSPSGAAYAAHISYGASTAVQTSPSYCIGSECMAWDWLGWRHPGGGVTRNLETSEHPHVGTCGKARSLG